MFSHDLAWGVFGVIILVMFAIDLGFFHRESHKLTLREATIWSVVWIALALIFNAWIFYTEGAEHGLLFLSGYLTEKSLSVDNLFVFLIIFSYFHVPEKYQHKVLFYGIIGAIITRGILIATGIALLQKFEWLTYVLGLFLVYAGIHAALQKDLKDIKLDLEHNRVLSYMRRHLPLTERYHEGDFFLRLDGKFFFTPLFLVLLAIEMTDIVFALDSIPAILAITRDPFLVFSSNLFAILGLRALYFVLAGTLETFRYLHRGVSAVLVFVGIKMLITHFADLSGTITLAVIATLLVGSILASVLLPESKK